MQGDFTATSIDCSMPCAAAEQHMCDLFHQLATWNMFLFPAGLQLREISGVIPQLSLVTTSKPQFAEFSPSPECMQKALKTAQWILKSHQCIVALDLSLEGLETWEDTFFEDLKGSSSVKYLKIKGGDSTCSGYMCGLVLSLKHLEELDIETEGGTSQLQSALSSLLGFSVTLKVFRSQRLKVHGDSSMLLGALSANATLNELSLNEGILSRAGEECCEAFAKYLENSATLATFNYSGDHVPTSGRTFSSVIGGLLKNKTNRNLSLTEFILDCESNHLISILLETGEFLHCFKITTELPNFVARCCDQQENHSSWPTALARSKALQEVTLSMRFCDAADWRFFLDGLTSNASTMKVIVHAGFDSPDELADVCKVLQQRCLDGSFIFRIGAC
ncbi:hypothetical protein HPB48_027140 [Haemaphysalis longicornis]|uniref:Uncharacterized protein n=1 Tax=Haemaphysalis longicornis TaxID=44386 RepID=A0A9J6HCH9_HAELO|nr:hypothetical protein HPB48_027140 [Haemaphysalis longicornis]